MAPLLDGPALPPVPPALARLLPAGAVAPRYGGRSLVNLPPTVGRLLGVEEGWRAPPVDEAALPAGPCERVLVLVVDGLGWDRLRRRLEHDDGGFAGLWERWGSSAAPLTSVAPATTSVATTALLGDGAGPAETGQLGYTYLLPELGLVANMLFWRPAHRPAALAGELEAWGLRPEGFLPTRTSAEVLAAARVPMRAWLPAAYARSPLSRMQLRGAEVAGYLSDADLFAQLAGWADATAGRRAYGYAYYPHFDALAHRDGSDAPSWDAQWEAFVADLRRFLVALSAPARRGLRLLLVADHGHVPCPPGRRRDLRDAPAVTAASAVRPGGEPRHLYLYARGGAAGELRDAARAALGEDFLVLDGAEALAAGLYGDPARAHRDAPRRLGDVIAIARRDASAWDDDVPVLGMHGALEPADMLVPLLGLEPER